MTEIQIKLFQLQDEKYRDFNAKLIPTVNKSTVIGVRTPDLRKFANELLKNGQGSEFIINLPHKYYEENNLHAFLLEKITDFNILVKELDRFLPFVDNWATCDSMNPKVFAKYPEKTKKQALLWIKSKHTYTVRYGIGLLMRYFLDENFTEDVLQTVAAVKSDEYYINMMIAWFFATALAKQYNSTVLYLYNNNLDKWIHNKTIQKAVESYRIPDETKKHLRTLKKTPVN